MYLQKRAENGKPLFKRGEQVFVSLYDSAFHEPAYIALCIVRGHYKTGGTYGYELAELHVLRREGNNGRTNELHRCWIEEQPLLVQEAIVKTIGNDKMRKWLAPKWLRFKKRLEGTGPFVFR